MDIILSRSTAILLLLILALSTNTIQAQWGAPTSISTPYGKAIIPGHYYGNNFFFHNNKPVNKKYDYTVVLLNDSTVTVKTKLIIDFKKNHSKISWKESNGNKKTTKSITPKETKLIYRVNHKGEKIIGIPTDSTWMFLVKEENLRSYSINSDIQSPIITCFQMNEGGKILPLTKENLLKIIGDEDPALVKIINKNKLLKAIEYYNNNGKKKDSK